MCSAPPSSNDQVALRATASATAASQGPEVGRVAVELGSRWFEVASGEEITGDRVLLEEGIAAVTAYLPSRVGGTDA